MLRIIPPPASDPGARDLRRRPLHLRLRVFVERDYVLASDMVSGLRVLKLPAKA
jgi:hypothetical protein